jgi:ribonuclease BN (tRNA processing enzyme)
MELTIVGCAGSFPGPDSPASCYLIEAGGFRLLMDLGSGALGPLQRYCDLDQVDAVLLSHLHADHCLDLCGYAVARLYHPGGPRPRLPVYAPAGAAERMAAALGGDPAGMTDAFEFVTLAAGTLQIGPLGVTAAHMNHPVETFGFRLDHAGATLAYSADTGPCEELVGLAAAADVLLCEASFLEAPGGRPEGLHLTAGQAGAAGARAGVGRLVLTHLVAWNDREASRAEAAAVFGGELGLAAAGQHFALGG